MICMWYLAHKYHLWYFKIVSNFTCLTAYEITYNNFEMSLVVYSGQLISLQIILKGRKEGANKLLAPSFHYEKEHRSFPFNEL